MNRLVRTYRWIVGGSMLFALGGCFTSQQLFDFGRTEFARVISDIFGRVFQLVTLGIA